MREKKFMVLSATLALGLSLASTAGADSLLYISQVQIDGGSGHSGDDFVELFNPGDSPFNLNGYRLVKRTANGTADSSIKSWTSDALVPAHGFFLWANSNFSSISATPDATTTATIAADNGVAIRFGSADTGSIIDSVAWGTANNSFTNACSENPGANSALWRQDLFSSAASFAIASSSPRNSSIIYNAGGQATSTPPVSSDNNQNAAPSPNYFTTASSVKISELLPNPAGDDGGAEAVELVNAGAEIVKLDNWFLGDETDNGVKTNAYKLTDLFIYPGQYLVVSIPKGYFALNNTGGDAVNLYFADKTLADSVSYKDEAKEGLSFQKIGSQWLWGTPSLGSPNFLSTSPVVEPSTVKISEVMPNPQGSDEGHEWVELYNEGSEQVNLSGYFLDDTGSSSPGASSLLLNGQAKILPKSFLVINIPEDKFTLGNTSDGVRLFSPGLQLLQTVNYSNAPEGQSYSLFSDGSWKFALPTPGAENLTELPKYELKISELLPNPSSEQDEFIELKNLGTGELNLKGFIVQAGSRKFSFSDPAIVKAGEYEVLYEDDLPFHLRNSGQTVSLVDPFNRMVDTVSYGQSPSGYAYAASEAGDFSWTAAPTPGKSNEFVLGASTVADKSAADKAESLSKTKETELSRLIKQNLKQQQELLDQMQNLQLAFAAVQGQQAVDVKTGEEPAVIAEKKDNPPSAKNNYLDLGIAGVSAAGLIFLLRKVKLK